MQMYDDELNSLLDLLLVLAVRQLNDRQRPSDHDSTRSASAKRLTRQQELRLLLQPSSDCCDHIIFYHREF